MTILACIPVEITGAPTLTEVIAASLTTADLTGALAEDQQLILKDSNGDDIAIFQESDKGVQLLGHLTIGNLPGGVDSSHFQGDTLPFGLLNENRVTSLSPENSYWGAWGQFIGLELALTEDSDASVYGQDILISIPSDSTKEIFSLTGISGGVLNFGSGNVDNVYGLGFTANLLNADATINEVFGMSLNATHQGPGNNIVGAEINVAGGASVANSYGLKINNTTTSPNKYAIVTNAGHVVFNENSDNNMTLRVEGATNAHLLYTDGPNDRVGINDSTPDAKLDIIQSSTTAAIPVIELEQLDLSEEFFNFVGTVGVGNPIEAVGAKTLTVTHFARVAVNGSFLYMPVGTIA